MSRNQISLNEQTHTIAPKALAVLTYLAQHPRKVVSQDELLDKVWPDTLVTPNTLQRSIFIRGFNWSADGQSLLANANRSLTHVFLDGSETNYVLPFPVSQLLQWDSENNSALLLLNINGNNTLAEVGLNRSDINIINNKDVAWAKKMDNGEIIYMDHMRRFWRPGTVEDKLIETLTGQGGDRKRFISKNNVIYAINREKQLCSYDLRTNDFVLMGDMHKDVDYLSDINQTDILFTFVVTAKKEVVELYVDG